MKPDNNNQNFLFRMPQKLRGAVGNRFLDPIRKKGLTDPKAIHDAVMQPQWQDSEHEAIFQEKAAAYPDEVWDCISWALWRAKISEEERQRLKAQQRAAGIKAWLESQPATDD